MIHCTGRTIRLANRKRCRVDAGFQGAAITGKGAVMLVSEPDRRD